MENHKKKKINLKQSLAMEKHIPKQMKLIDVWK